jgi:hypothetical protein
MTNRASADRPAAMASCILRVTIERRLSNSALLVASAVTYRPSNFAQLILITYHEQLGFVQYPCQEMIFRLLLLLELRWCVDSRIDCSAKKLVCVTQR